MWNIRTWKDRHTPCFEVVPIWIQHTASLTLHTLFLVISHACMFEVQSIIVIKAYLSYKLLFFFSFSLSENSPPSEEPHPQALLAVAVDAAVTVAGETTTLPVITPASTAEGVGSALCTNAALAGGVVCN